MDSTSKLARPIIEAAVTLFKRNGFEHVSVNEICQEAGIARSSFYRVFSCKKDIINYILQDARTNHNAAIDDLLDAKNDFERMWNLCDRLLSVVLDFGPELTASLISLELEEPIGILDVIHGMDPWLIKLARNAQQSGILLNPEPPERLIPLISNLVYQVTYNWCRCKGGYSLRRKARSAAEIVLYVAPEYRMTSDELERLV